MNDKELADRVVALGVGTKPDVANPAYALWFLGNESFEAHSFVRNWHVAGMLMGLALADYREMAIDYITEAMCEPGESLPRAIIEACVEALDE